MADKSKQISMKEFRKLPVYAPEIIGTKNKVNWELALQAIRESPMTTDTAVAVINRDFLVKKGDQVTRSSCVRKLNAEVRKGNLGKLVANQKNLVTGKNHTVAYYGPAQTGAIDQRPLRRKEKQARQLRTIGAEQHESPEGTLQIPTIVLPGSGNEGGN